MGELMDMAKQDLDHRHAVEKTEVATRKKAIIGTMANTILGTVSALIVTVATLYIVYLLISKGHGIAGLVPLLVPLSVLANIFLTKEAGPSDSTDGQDSNDPNDG